MRLRAFSLAVAAAIGLAVRSTAAAPPAIDAEALVVHVAGDPWRLVFADAAGSVVLREADDEPPDAPGGLAFRAGGIWRHATRVAATARTRDALALTLETTDPSRRLAVELRRDAEGVVALRAHVVGDATGDVDALGIAFHAEPGERFFGFGERATGVDHRGATVENHVADGPYQPEERPLVRLFVPAAGWRDRDDATYFPVPWLLSSRGVGVLVDNDETSTFRLGTVAPDRWSVEVTAAPAGIAGGPAPQALRLRVFAGPTPADVLRRFTARTGRQPAPAAPWVLGPWIQVAGALADRRARLAALRAAGAPFSVVQTYTHYLPCGDHRARREEERALVAAMHAAGAAVTTYVNPMICESYAPAFAEAVAAGALTRDATGAPYVYDYTGSTIFRVGQFDFTTPAGRRAYEERLTEAVRDGHDGWMEDFGEYTPLDAVSADDRTGSAHHNRYPVDYHCAAFAAVTRLGRPVVRFQRSGWTGAAPCAQVVWNGDPTTDWGFDGLTSALYGGLGMGFSGIALWGSDVGGFFALGDRALTPELLARWVQLGAVSGVMRTQHNGFALPPKPRPQIYDAGQLANWKRWAGWRTQLHPYVASAAAEYRRSGMPIMRHLALVHPDDPTAVARDDEFLFGPDLLAAPVLAPGARAREVYLPAGDWIDLWRAGHWDSASGSFVLGAATIMAGGAAIEVPAPLDELPLLVRAGAVLPLLPPDVDTLADYGEPSPDLVRLRDRRDHLHLLAFPRGETSLRLPDGERIRSREGDGAWELALRGREHRVWTISASLATLARPFAPCAVHWNGRPLAAGDWDVDAGTRVLRARVVGRRGRLVALAAARNGGRGPSPCVPTRARRTVGG